MEMQNRAPVTLPLAMLVKLPSMLPEKLPLPLKLSSLSLPSRSVGR